MQKKAPSALKTANRAPYRGIIEVIKEIKFTLFQDDYSLYWMLWSLITENRCVPKRSEMLWLPGNSEPVHILIFSNCYLNHHLQCAWYRRQNSPRRSVLVEDTLNEFGHGHVTLIVPVLLCNICSVSYMQRSINNHACVMRDALRGQRKIPASWPVKPQPCYPTHDGISVPSIHSTSQ